MSAVLTQRERVLDLLRQRPQSTLDLRASYIMASGCVVFKLRSEGHHIVSTRMPNRVVLYELVSEAA